MDLNDLIELIRSKTGYNPQRNGNNYSARCPAHEDRNPSLSVSETQDSKLLIKCHAGCTLEDICNTLGIKPYDLFPHKVKYHTKKYCPSQRQAKIEYIYTDADGVHLYKKVRLPRKSFYIETWSEEKWVTGLKIDTRVLYALPKVAGAISSDQEIYLVEGEKDAETLLLRGLIATTPIEGAGSSLSSHYVSQLQNANIVLLYDEDEAGYKRRDQWIELLNGVAKSIKVVALPGLTYQKNHGRDVTDWLTDGHTIQELLQLTTATKANNFEISIPKKNPLVVISLQEFLEKDIRPREMILSPLIPTQGLVMLYAKRGIGKTFIALGMAFAVAAGSAILKWSAPKPRKVLYVDGEMPASAMQERLSLLAIGLDQELPDPSFFRLITPDLQPEGIPDLATAHGQQSIEDALCGAELLILDNLSTLVRATQENESDAWLPIQEWVLKLRRRGISILIVHHAGKSGQQRGTSRREDVLDSVVVLKQPLTYSPKDGAKFEISYEKSRSFYGKEAEPFGVCMTSSDQEGIQWTINSIANVNEINDQVIELRQKGQSYRDIAKALDITRNRVATIINKAKEVGLLKGIHDE